ncbi:hypothetical protein [Agarivorans sp. 1_MG-2023]|uniref:hypothetical protein n=1 Tax=Agarivorans sp. 1_MG-2023 TaxID=3062634 RepID=UPI0026E25BAB|nr:hypothetical protein [Agarivorans sp. 1_MG-2023]MDO6762839.1 hypothetical protein [Agarivorans sp. 1_MG-2023]
MNTFKNALNDLKSKDPKIRNKAALALRDLGDQRAVGPLISAIINPDNSKSIGTMLYALEVMDCRELFLPLIRIAIGGNFEASAIALDLLHEKDFFVTDEDFTESKSFLDNIERSDLKDFQSVALNELTELFFNESV